MRFPLVLMPSSDAIGLNSGTENYKTELERFFLILPLARVRSNDALDVIGLAVEDCGSEALLTLVRNCTNGRALLSSAVILQSWFNRNACILSN